MVIIRRVVPSLTHSAEPRDFTLTSPYLTARSLSFRCIGNICTSLHRASPGGVRSGPSVQVKMQVVCVDNHVYPHAGVRQSGSGCRSRVDSLVLSPGICRDAAEKGPPVVYLGGIHPHLHHNAGVFRRLNTRKHARYRERARAVCCCTAL